MVSSKSNFTGKFIDYGLDWNVLGTMVKKKLIGIVFCGVVLIVGYCGAAEYLRIPFPSGKRLSNGRLLIDVSLSSKECSKYFVPNEGFDIKVLFPEAQPIGVSKVSVVHMEEEIARESEEEDNFDDSELLNSSSHVAGVAQALVNDVTELIKNPQDIEVRQLIKLKCEFLRRAEYTSDDIRSMICPLRRCGETLNLYNEIITSL
jgi:hypothetical protein